MLSVLLRMEGGRMKKSIVRVLFSAFVILFGMSTVFASETLNITNLTKKQGDIYVVKARV